MLNVKKLLTKICKELSIVSFTKGTATTSGKTFILPNNYRGIFWVLTSTANYCGEYVLFTTGGGVVGTKTISAASNVTITTSTNNSIKITTSAGTADVFFVNVQGKAT